MKKTLVALAALAATGAFAQTSVTLYGVIDAGVASLKNVGDGTKNATVMTDGALSSSVWGLRGSEDLGGGLKANFNVESDLSMNNGTHSSAGFWRRASNVGISGNFGAIDVGVKLNPVIATNGALMTTAGNSVSTMTSGAFGFSDFYTRNALTYTSPSVMGLVAQAQKGLSQTANNGGDMTAFSLAYTNGPLELRYASQDRKGPVSTSGAVYSVSGLAATADGNKKTNIMGAKFTMGNWKLAIANYENKYVTTAAAAINGEIQNKGTGMSASYQVNAQTSIGAARMTGKTTGQDSNSTLTHLQARYELSKRTQLYTVWGQADNKGANNMSFWPYASNTNSATGSTTATTIWDTSVGAPGTGIANQKSSGMGVGVIHTF